MHDGGNGDRVAQHGGQTPNIGDLQPWFTIYLFDIGYPCYAQLTPAFALNNPAQELRF